MVLGCYSNIKAGFKDPVASADHWNRFRKFSGIPSAPHFKVSGGLLGNFQAWSRVNLRTMLTSCLRFPALPGVPRCAGSSGEAGCVPRSLRAMTGPPDVFVIASSPYIDFILTRINPTGPNGLISLGPKVI
jgi:hypothetical protein